MKFDYFDALEELVNSVRDRKGDIDKRATDILRRLSTDFITPIDRADLGRIVLSLRRCGGAMRGKEEKEIGQMFEVVTEYIRALGAIGKRGSDISPRLFFERSRELSTRSNSPLFNELCNCCELLILAVLNNI